MRAVACFGVLQHGFIYFCCFSLPAYQLECIYEIFVSVIFLFLFIIQLTQCRYFDRNSLLLLFWCGLIVGSFAGMYLFFPVSLLACRMIVIYNKRYEGISEHDGYLSEKTIFLLSAGMGAQLISMTIEVLF